MWRELLSVTFYRAVFTEFLLTAIFIFFGVGSMLQWPSALPSVLQIAITFNLAAATMVQIAWHASGAHINPAVTVAFLLGSRVSLVRAACYVVAQLAGGIAGAATLYAVTPGNIRGDLGINMVRNNVTAQQAVIVEIILTLQLVLCYFVSTDSRHSSGSPAVMIGVSVALGHLVGIFWVGPLAGAILASLLYNFVLYHDPKTFKQRVAIFKGTYDAEQLQKDGEQQQSVSLSMSNLVQRL